MASSTISDRLESVVVPKRAGRCASCGNYYYARCLEVVRSNGRWVCLRCARPAKSVEDRRALLREWF